MLATAKWLAESHEVDIACWQIEFAADSGAEHLSFTCVYPPVELANAARIRGRGREAKPLRFANWEAALEAIKNPAVVAFYKQRLAENVQNRLRRRILVVNIGGKTVCGCQPGRNMRTSGSAAVLMAMLSSGESG